MQNDIFNDKLKFDSATQNFNIIEEEGLEDPLTAVQFATNLPFRVGVSKSIILIPCQECRSVPVKTCEKKLAKTLNILGREKGCMDLSEISISFIAYPDQ